MPKHNLYITQTQTRTPKLATYYYSMHVCRTSYPRNYLPGYPFVFYCYQLPIRVCIHIIKIKQVARASNSRELAATANRIGNKHVGVTVAARSTATNAISASARCADTRTRLIRRLGLV